MTAGPWRDAFPRPRYVVRPWLRRAPTDGPDDPAPERTSGGGAPSGSDADESGPQPGSVEPEPGAGQPEPTVAESPPSGTVPPPEARGADSTAADAADPSSAPTPPHGVPHVPPAQGASQQGGPWNAWSPETPWQGPPPRQERRVLAVAVVAVLLLVGAAAGGWILYDRAQRSVALIAATDPGDDPFTPSLVQGGGLPPTTPLDRAANPTPAGGLDGLYFDSLGAGICDQRRLGTELQVDPALAAAWVAPLGVAPSELSRFVTALTPVRLRADTRLTAHGWSGEVAEPYAAALQAGTPVLVDDRGVPRVRCADGAPLAPTLPLPDPVYGSGWDGFDPATMIEITPATRPIVEFGLVDVAGGQPFRRPVGSTGDQDVAALPETGRLAGTYDLTGTQIRCEGIPSCPENVGVVFEPTFSGCPAACVVTDVDVGESVPLTRDGTTWRVSGDLPAGRGADCQGQDVQETYAVSVAPTRSEIVDGVWTAVGLSGEYVLSFAGNEDCRAGEVAWSLSGTGGG